METLIVSLCHSSDAQAAGMALEAIATNSDPLAEGQLRCLDHSSFLHALTPSSAARLPEMVRFWR